MTRTLLAAIALCWAQACAAATLSDELAAKLETDPADQEVQVLISFVGGKPDRDALRTLGTITDKVFAVSGGRLIGVVLPLGQVRALKDLPGARTIELAGR